MPKTDTHELLHYTPTSKDNTSIKRTGQEHTSRSIVAPNANKLLGSHSRHSDIAARSLYPKQHRSRMSDFTLFQQNYVPFLNERNHLGRLILTDQHKDEDQLTQAPYNATMITADEVSLIDNMSIRKKKKSRFASMVDVASPSSHTSKMNFSQGEKTQELPKLQDRKSRDDFVEMMAS
jgi:GTP-sensing pleiotropic transcriptional regulator CodY